MATNLLPLNIATASGNGGSGKFSPLRKGQGAARPVAYNPFTTQKYDRMDFKGTKDPVYIVFDYLDKQPISKLAADFVKENITTPFKRVLQSIAA